MYVVTWVRRPVAHVLGTWDMSAWGRGHLCMCALAFTRVYLCTCTHTCAPRCIYVHVYTYFLHVVLCPFTPVCVTIWPHFPVGTCAAVQAYMCRTVIIYRCTTLHEKISKCVPVCACINDTRTVLPHVFLFRFTHGRLYTLDTSEYVQSCRVHEKRFSCTCLPFRA